MKIGVVDYEAGNLRSVETALRFLSTDRNFSFFISSDPEVLLEADRLVFPGVGEARAAMGALTRRGLGDAIGEFLTSGKPVIGICLGCQIVLSRSEESDTTCLGFIDGTARLFPPAVGLKVPHMGWNQVSHDGHPLFAGIPSGSSFYFVHSYYPVPDDPAAGIAFTEYGLRFASGLRKDNLVAFQFHPEKSGRHGLRLLENFISWRP